MQFIFCLLRTAYAGCTPSALSSEGVFVEDVDCYTLCRSIEEELRVTGALIGSDRIVHHCWTQMLDILLHGRDSAGSISESREWQQARLQE